MTDSAVASSSAPLDIFLLRGHGLPLPNIVSPSLSFLVHISPRAYLGLVKSSSSSDSDVSTIPLDVQSDSVQRLMLHGSSLDKSLVNQYTMATLTLDPSGGSSVKPSPVGEVPNFDLLDGSSSDDIQSRVSVDHLNHAFGISATNVGETSVKADVLEAAYYLDIGGVCMRREAMARLALGTGAAIHDHDPFGIMQPITTYASPHWVDLIVRRVIS